MKPWFLFFLIVVAAISIYGLVMFEPEFVILFSLLLIIMLITIAADLAERFLPKSKLGKFIRKIEDCFFNHAGF